MKWLVDKCRESEAFSWALAITGIAIMVLIAVM